MRNVANIPTQLGWARDADTADTHARAGSKFSSRVPCRPGCVLQPSSAQAASVVSAPYPLDENDLILFLCFGKDTLNSRKKHISDYELISII